MGNNRVFLPRIDYQSGIPFDLPQRFYDRIKKTDSGCWEWIACRTKFGYGQIHFMGQNHTAHRLMLASKGTKLGGDIVARHKCDNPPCCNPDHLETGTMKDNSQDRESRGRGNRRHRVGSDAARAIHTEAEVLMFRDMFAKLPRGEKGCVCKGAFSDLASALGIPKGRLKAIVRGQNWKHI